MKLTLRNQLIIAFALCSVAALIVGVISYSALRQLGTSFKTNAEIDVPAVRACMTADMMHDGLRAVVFRSIVAAEKPDDIIKKDIKAELAEFSGTFTNAVLELKRLLADRADRQAAEAVERPLAEYLATAQGMVSLAFEDRSKALAELPHFQEAFKHLEDAMKKLDDRVESHAREGSVDGIALAQRNSRLIVINLLCGFVTVLVAGFIFASRLSKKLEVLTHSLAAASTATDEMAEQITTASQHLAEGASEQAASLEETSASLEEMTSMVKRNAESAHKAKDIATETCTVANSGTTDMAEMKAAMNEIKAANSEVAKIVKDIDEIAFQTNILALNAAVEAARAGEAGMGFAVVADEVRNLAQRSARSAKETATKIEDAITKSDRGVNISVKIAASFEQIAAKTREVDQFVAEIASASTEQAQGVSQVNLAITEMDKVTQANAASAEQSASAAQELSGQARSVKESMHTLLILVDGVDLMPTVKHAAVKVSPPTTTFTAAKSKPAARNGNHNGAHHETNGKALLVGAPSHKNGGIPMADDFKDF